VVTLAGIGYYGQDLDIGDFGRKSATMAGIGPTMGMKPLLAFFFFFQQEWVVFASRGNNGGMAYHLD
jgi:hypothetical protein